MQKSINFLLGAILALGLAACGGGGSSDGSPCLAVGGCGGTTTDPAAAEYTVTLSPTATALKYPGAATVSVVVKSKSGAVVPGATVSFTVSDTAKATVSNGGSILADGNGQGSFTVLPLSDTSQGVVRVTVTATIGTKGTATATLDFELNVGTTSGSSGGSAAAAKLKYQTSQPTRLFVRGASAGNTNAVEVTLVKFQVRDSADNVVKTPTLVYFDVTKRNESNSTNTSSGVLTCTPDLTGKCLNVANSNKQYAVQSDDTGIATIAIQSGDEPMSFNVLAGLSPYMSGTYNSSTGLAANPSGVANTVPVWISSDQFVVSSNKPDQSKFFMLWAPGATCNGVAVRTYPCEFVVNVYDKIGQPVANGTPVNVVSSTGGVVADVLADQPSGTCLTKNSQCKGAYTGKNFDAVPRGQHKIVAYTLGENATPTGLPIRDDGVVGATGNIVVNCLVPGSNCAADSYIRDMLKDN